MKPALWVLIAWLFFGGSHLLLSWPPVRAVLVKRLGENRFIILYVLLAAVGLSLLAFTGWRHADLGLSGLQLTNVPLARWLLGGTSALGAALGVAGLANYARSPMAVLARRWRASAEAANKPLRPPATVERIARHPFFIGLAVLMTSHALLASTLASAVFFAGFALLALAGIPLQDRKLLARHGKVYGDYMAQTSVFTLNAKSGGTDHQNTSVLRVAVVWLAGPVVLGALHPLWRISHGALFAVVAVLGGLIAVAWQFGKARRQ